MHGYTRMLVMLQAHCVVRWDAVRNMFPFEFSPSLRRRITQQGNVEGLGKP